MAQFLYLTKRNILLYLRDKEAVFFSLLSMLIIIALMLFFLGDMYSGNIADVLSVLPGRDTVRDRENAELFMLVWTLAGVIPINASMVALSSLSSMIKDRENNRSASIYSAPVSRLTITLSYIAASCVASVMVCSVTLAFSEAYLCVKGLSPFGIAEHGKLFGMILINSFTYSSIMYIAAIFVSTESAWSGFGTVVGTIVGFLGGIYLPVGSLSEGIVNFLSCSPVIYGTVMFRNVMMKGISDKFLSDAPLQMTEEINKNMGIDFNAFGHSISASGCVMIVAAFGLLFTMLGTAATIRSSRKDR